MGARTYNNTHCRAEFLNAIGGPTSVYGTHYDVNHLPPHRNILQAITVGHSAIIFDGGGCALLGGIDFNFFDNYLSTTVLSAAGGDPTSFVIFLMRDVWFYQGDTSTCCFVYHYCTPQYIQTYSPLVYDTTGLFGSVTDVSVAAHEVGEWLDDPLVNNLTPAWG